MQGIKQCTKGEDRKITMKQYPFCEIKFVFYFAASLKLFFHTTWSCDKRGLINFYFALI